MLLLGRMEKKYLENNNGNFLDFITLWYTFCTKALFVAKIFYSSSFYESFFTKKFLHF